MTRVRRLLKQTSGATAVEFALTAPLFIALIFGVINAGIALWMQFGLENAVEMASRCAAVNTTTCSSSSTIATYAASNALGATLPASAFAYSKVGCGHQVTGSYTYTYITHYFGSAATVTLSAKSCHPDINAGG